MKTTCEILPHQAASGPANMALDEALLDRVAQEPDRAFLRTYEWSIPSLSLGYFQAIGEAESELRWQGVPIVRRVSGGGAIWHHHEVTYALVLPGAHPLARRGESLYAGVHEAIAAVFKSERIELSRRGAAGLPTGVRDRPFLCFADRGAEDLVAGGSKVVGSAQRRRRGAVLQHGSILLERSPTTPELPGIADLAAIRPDPAYWAGLLARIVPEALGFLPWPSEPPDSVQSRAVALESTIYKSPSWTRRR